LAELAPWLAQEYSAFSAFLHEGEIDTFPDVS